MRMDHETKRDVLSVAGVVPEPECRGQGSVWVMQGPAMGQDTWPGFSTAAIPALQLVNRDLR